MNLQRGIKCSLLQFSKFGLYQIRGGDYETDNDMNVVSASTTFGHFSCCTHTFFSTAYFCQLHLALTCSELLRDHSQTSQKAEYRQFISNRNNSVCYMATTETHAFVLDLNSQCIFRRGSYHIYSLLQGVTPALTEAVIYKKGLVKYIFFSSKCFVNQTRLVKLQESHHGAFSRFHQNC